MNEFVLCEVVEDPKHTVTLYGVDEGKEVEYDFVRGFELGYGVVFKMFNDWYKVVGVEEFTSEVIDELTTIEYRCVYVGDEGRPELIEI